MSTNGFHYFSLNFFGVLSCEGVIFIHLFGVFCLKFIDATGKNSVLLELYQAERGFIFYFGIEKIIMRFDNTRKWGCKITLLSDTMRKLFELK